MNERFNLQNELIDRQDICRFIEDFDAAPDKIKFISDNFFKICHANDMLCSYRHCFYCDTDFPFRHQYWSDLSKLLGEKLRADNLEAHLIKVFKENFKNKENACKRELMDKLCDEFRWCDSIPDFHFNLYNSESSLLDRIIETLRMINNQRITERFIPEQDLEFIERYRLTEKKDGVLALNERGKKALLLEPREKILGRVYLIDFLKLINS